MDIPKEKGGKKKKKEDKPERGADTLFKISLVNFTRLSGIADRKANILLSVNAIIISITLARLFPKLDNASNGYLVIPTFIMLISSVITIIFAILSTRPKIARNVFTDKDIEDRKVNLLFFGNFHKIPLLKYRSAMTELMKDQEYLYNSLIDDMYYLGIALEKKFKILRIAYNIFMIGLLITVLAFVIAFLTN